MEPERARIEQLVDETLARAYLPDRLARERGLVLDAVVLFADELSEGWTTRFAELLGGEAVELLAEHRAKRERSLDELIERLAAERGVSASVADDLWGAFFEALWRVLDRETIEALVVQLPADVARELRAGMPGQKRGAV